MTFLRLQTCSRSQYPRWGSRKGHLQLTIQKVGGLHCHKYPPIIIVSIVAIVAKAYFLMMMMMMMMRWWWWWCCDDDDDDDADDDDDYDYDDNDDNDDDDHHHHHPTCWMEIKALVLATVKINLPPAMSSSSCQLGVVWQWGAHKICAILGYSLHDIIYIYSTYTVNPPGNSRFRRIFFVLDQHLLLSTWTVCRRVLQGACYRHGWFIQGTAPRDTVTHPVKSLTLAHNSWKNDMKEWSDWHEWMHAWMIEWTNEQTNEWISINQWTNEQMNARTNNIRKYCPRQ